MAEVGGRAAGELAVASALISTQPGEALLLTEPHLASANRSEAFEAHRIAGYAAREMQNIELSTTRFEAALTLTHRESPEAARVSLSLSGNQALLGRFAEAHKTLDLVARDGGLGEDQYLVAVQRASIFHIEDRLTEAVAISRTLLSEVPDLDASLRAHVLGNLGSSLNQLGRFGEARDALVDALALYDSVGELRPQLDVLSNLALCEAWSLNLPAALSLFRRGKKLAGSLGVEDAIGGLDEARALVEAGLGHEALEAANTATDRFEHGGTAAWSGEALLVRAHALLTLDRPGAAAAAARDAVAAFERQGRFESALLATKSAWMASLAQPDFCAVDDVRSTARQLDDVGYRIDAQELHAKLAIASYENGSTDDARMAAHDCVAGPDSTPASQSRRLIAAAILLLLDGNDVGALTEFDRAVAVLEAHRLALGATELRARASRLGADLSRLAVRAAMRSADASSVLVWSEKLRSNTLSIEPTRAFDSPEIAAAAATLRFTSAATRAGGDPRLVDVEQRRLISLLRAQAPSARGRSDAAAIPPPNSSSFFELDNWLYRIDVDDRGDVGAPTQLLPLTELTSLLATIRACWRRRLRLSASTSANAAQDALRSAIHALDLALAIQPMGPDLFVVVSDSLHAVPWSALPSLEPVRLSVAPTASVLGAGPVTGTTGVTVVAGAGLAFADAEVDAVSAVWPSARSFHSDDSDVELVLAAIAESRVAHLAAHGTFRADNAMFGSLELHDGPLTVIDIEGLEVSPEIAVLSACDAGRSAVLEGNEILGFIAALLASGCRSVVAPVIAVSDERSAAVMPELHRRLAAGASPAHALRSSIDTFETGSPEWLLAASFVCFGAG